jgi:hypothetical protein
MSASTWTDADTVPPAGSGTNTSKAIMWRHLSAKRRELTLRPAGSGSVTRLRIFGENGSSKAPTLPFIACG